MPNQLSIQPASGPLRGCFSPPGSKSLSNRAILCAALAEGTSRLTGLLDCDDTRLMAQALEQLGVPLQLDWPSGEATLNGCLGKFPALPTSLYCGNSGTTIRFLAAAVAASGGHFQLDGNERMRQRPIGDLLSALNQLGSSARSLLGTDCPPIEVHSTGWTGGHVSVKGDKSSQFLSALLMAAPLAKGPVQIALTGPLVSLPYIEMTCEVMRHFGVVTEQLPGPVYQITPQTYRRANFRIEPDASAASYFFAAAAICGGTVEIEGLGRNSLQGDLQFVHLLEQMGCEIQLNDQSTSVTGRSLQGINCSMTHISDTVQTLAVVALFAQGPTTIRGVAHIRHKESDRIGDLARELRRAGADVQELEDGLQITPRQLTSTEFQTYDDHRMAMSLALVGLKQPGIRITNPECVSKTYPDFFRDLQGLVQGNFCQP